MQTTHTVSVRRELPIPQRTLWEKVSDHEATPTWVNAAKRVRLIREGEPRNGKGAIRVVEFRPLLWTTIREEIIHFDPPREFRYHIIGGMPGLRDHLGRITVESLGDARSLFTWHVEFEFKQFHPFRPFVPNFIRSFRAVLEEAARGLALRAQGGSGAIE
jgi:hypothetical protein